MSKSALHLVIAPLLLSLPAIAADRKDYVNFDVCSIWSGPVVYDKWKDIPGFVPKLVRLSAHANDDLVRARLSRQVVIEGLVRVLSEPAYQAVYAPNTGPLGWEGVIYLTAEERPFVISAFRRPPNRAMWIEGIIPAARGEELHMFHMIAAQRKMEAMNLKFENPIADIDRVEVPASIQLLLQARHLKPEQLAEALDRREADPQFIDPQLLLAELETGFAAVESRIDIPGDTPLKVKMSLHLDWGGDILRMVDFAIVPSMPPP